MRFELEDKIGYVDTEQEDSSATGNDQKSFLTLLISISD